ncbi:universal stress protein [Mycolicibacterium tokaiense]|uniref:Universal stress protein UspA-like protein n=1 Tax=Mycolicibacterium tokaiense TaxID=39695 RepID=A0A378TCH7_9MYCO|nr:universal stress protein [Mycolicibacterium tokaiense]BBY87632.1 universal stress protein UspA [Mycolicibacterium tokaiense]STZ57847.1 universal stress protein UspA-like protein [Mycolicibacterium tokaiense]
MHLTVGYLATPTGKDGIALAADLALTFDADVDVVLIVREELPDGHPGRAEYQQMLVSQGEKWVAEAVATLADWGVTASSAVLVGESFAESLIEFAESKHSDMIVVGGAKDGFFGGHTIGPVAGALLHCSPIPVALAPRGWSDEPPVKIREITVAVPTTDRTDNPLPIALTLASAAALPLRMISLVTIENIPEKGSTAVARRMQVEAAEQNLLTAARSVPEAPDIQSLVADGTTLESALRKLKWADGDLLVVGSSRFAAPRRIFLGSTAARILAGVDVPVIVVPKGQ